MFGFLYWHVKAPHSELCCKVMHHKNVLTKYNFWVWKLRYSPDLAPIFARLCGAISTSYFMTNRIHCHISYQYCSHIISLWFIHIQFVFFPKICFHTPLSDHYGSNSVRTLWPVIWNNEWFYLTFLIEAYWWQNLTIFAKERRQYRKEEMI